MFPRRFVPIFWMSCAVAMAQALVTVKGAVTGPKGAPVPNAPVQAKDVGHLEVKITVDDPGTLTKPWHINMVWGLAPKEDIIETVCTENNADVPRYVGK
jgi:hypothetical protein